jgi:twitching motility protein PilT
MQLSVNLVGVVSQTLVRRKDNRGRVAAYEVLVATGAVRNLIRENKSYQINSLIQTGARQKMNTLDQSLANLVERGLVDIEDARLRAKDPADFERIASLTSEHTQKANAAAAAAQATNGQQAKPPVVQAPSVVRGQPNRPTYRRD